MCICINCLYVHNCSTYQYIKQQHQEIHKVIISRFNPINTVINVNLYNNYKRVQLDWDIVECLSFIDKPGYWKEQENL
uniref:Ycf34 n=1 Tax=Dichotomaria marginata TaxID=268567 RepID=A0A1G4NS72_9FLOR|nr:Hypothetical protein ycf34 [Dichotomaria marginata]SCW21522.1 Hypothetical protein ycf34 [Dichotomaria marginata]